MLEENNYLLSQVFLITKIKYKFQIEIKILSLIISRANVWIQPSTAYKHEFLSEPENLGYISKYPTISKNIHWKEINLIMKKYWARSLKASFQPHLSH